MPSSLSLLIGDVDRVLLGRDKAGATWSGPERRGWEANEIENILKKRLKGSSTKPREKSRRQFIVEF